MTKTIKIDGQDVVLKTNGIVPLLYNKEIKSDFFTDSFNLSEAADIGVLFNLLWVYAKIGDSNIPDLWQWLERFEEIPIMDFYADILELTMTCIASKKKLKNKSAAVKH